MCIPCGEYVVNMWLDSIRSAPDSDVLELLPFGESEGCVVSIAAMIERLSLIARNHRSVKSMCRDVCGKALR